MEKLELAGEFLKLTGIPHQKTFPILTARTVLDHYGPGVKEWGSVVERLSRVIENSPDYEDHFPAPITTEDKEHELAAWLNNLDLEGEESKEEGEDAHGCANPRANPKRVELYRCTHCGNPSAVLRKCRCNKVRLVSDFFALCMISPATMIVSDNPVFFCGGDPEGTATQRVRSRAGKSISRIVRPFLGLDLPFRLLRLSRRT